MIEKDINVREILNAKRAITEEQGKKIYSILEDNFNKNIVSNIYFKDLDAIATIFLNNSIGKLYTLGDTKKLNSLVKIKTKGITKVQFNKIKLVMTNAKSKLSEDETDREIF